MNYALVRPNDTIEVILPDRAIDLSAQVRPGWRWLPVEDAGAPVFDATTQVREGPINMVEETRVFRSYVVRDKTQAELDATREQQVTNFDVVAFKVALNHENRIRTLEGRAQVTAAQFRNALKALL